MSALLTAPRPRRERPAATKQLPEIADLFGRSWRNFQQRFAVLIGLYLLSMVAFIVPPALLLGAAILSGMAKGGALFLILAATGALAGLYGGFSCFGSFLHAVADEDLSFKDALAKGRSIALPLLWVGFLTGFVISGGFLLFIIPGIIFMVWFFFAQFILVAEDVRGMGALLKSREYLRGQWFNVALRLLLVWAASAIVGAIPLAGPLLAIAFLPFVMIFHYLLYRDLAELKGEIPYPCGTGDLLKWPAIALAGFVLVPAAIVFLAGGAALGKLRQLQAGNVTISASETTAAPATHMSGEYRIIDFPPKEGATQTTISGGEATSSPQTAISREETPDHIHTFIYAVNYTGTVRANGTAMKDLEGKTDVQYSYNLGGNGLRYGENRIDLDFAELPAGHGSMLEVHIKISRNLPGREREVLGEWRVNEKGSGTRSFTLTIPKP